MKLIVKKIVKNFGVSWWLFVFLTLGFVSVFTIPKPIPNHRVNDFAGILSETVKSKLENLSAQVDKETTAEITVVTVTSLEGLTIEEYANTLFNNWGIGKKDVNNGVLLLVAPNERRMRIEVGYGLEPLLTDRLCGEIRDDYVIPDFKNGNYSSGTQAGIEAIAKILLENPQAAKGVKGSAPSFIVTPLKKAKYINLSLIVVAIIFLIFALFFINKQKRYSATLLFTVLIVLVVLEVVAVSFAVPFAGKLNYYVLSSLGTVFLSIIYNLKKYSRFGPNYCKRCGTQMLFLEEAKEDEKLNDIQKLEEKIGAVDYDVWVCPSCLTADVERYINWWSQYKKCPRCSHQTFEEIETVEINATTYYQGRKRIDGSCVSCKYTSVRYATIPMLTESEGFGSSSSSSSGGGGFGGGSSGGGGASGGW